MPRIFFDKKNRNLVERITNRLRIYQDGHQRASQLNAIKGPRRGHISRPHLNRFSIYWYFCEVIGEQEQLLSKLNKAARIRARR